MGVPVLSHQLGVIHVLVRDKPSQETSCSFALVHGLSLLSVFTLSVEICGGSPVFTHSPWERLPGEIRVAAKPLGGWRCLFLVGMAAQEGLQCQLRAVAQSTLGVMWSGKLNWL